MANRRAFGSVEEEWVSYYRDGPLTGDGRFAVADGAFAAEELTITVRNAGQLVDDRGTERIDLTWLG